MIYIYEFPSLRPSGSRGGEFRGFSSSCLLRKRSGASPSHRSTEIPRKEPTEVSSQSSRPPRHNLLTETPSSPCASSLGTAAPTYPLIHAGAPVGPLLNRRRRGYSIDGGTSTQPMAAPLLNRRRCGLLNRQRSLLNRRRCGYRIGGGAST